MASTRASVTIRASLDFIQRPESSWSKPTCSQLPTSPHYTAGRGFARQEAVFHQHFEGYRRSSTKKGENTFPQTAAPPSSTLLWQEEPAQLTSSPQTRQLAKKLQKMFFSPKGNHKLRRVRTPTVLRQQQRRARARRSISLSRGQGRGQERSRPKPPTRLHIQCDKNARPKRNS